MTDDQRERIRAAVRELQAALNAVGDDFRIEHHKTDVTTIDDNSRRYLNDVTVECVTREVVR